jgi:O-antigen/teichoic acid export membrane protein
MMHDGLARSFIFLSAGNVLGPVFSMALVLAISHLRGMEMLGQYSLVMTVFVVGQACATLGLPVIVTREVARDRKGAGRYLFNATLVAGVLVGLALLAIIPAAAWLVREDDMRMATSLALLTLLPSALVANAEAVLLAFGRAGDYVGVALGENLTRAGLGTVLVLLGFGVTAIAAALLALRVAAGILLVVIVRRRGASLTERLDRRLCRSLLSEIPVVAAIPIVNQLYARADVFVLTWLGTWRDVGLYSAGLRLTDLARTLPAAYGKALYPVLSRLHGGPGGEFASTVRRALRQVLLLVAPMVVVLAGFASILIPGFFGPDAAGGERTMALLACSLLPLGMACVLAQVLFATGRQAVDLRINVIATFASVIANLLLIPRLGALGAALAMVAVTTLYAALQYRSVRACVLDPRMLGHLGRLLLVVAVSIAVGLVAVDAAAPLAVLLVAATYGIGVLLTGLLTRDDLGRFWQSAAARSRWLWGER